MCVYSLSYPAYNASALCCIVVWPIQLYRIFPHYPINSMIFVEKSYWSLNACFGFFIQLWSETFLIKWNERDIIPNVLRSSCEIYVILWDFNETWIFWTVFFSKNTQTSNIMKILPMEGSCSMRSDGRQTGVTKLIVAFRTIANALKEPWSMNVFAESVNKRKLSLYSCLESSTRSRIYYILQ